MSRKIRIALMTAVTLAVAGAGNARAGFVIDQSNTVTATQFFNTGPGAFSNLPIGQEFTPTLNSVDFVDLHIEDAGSDIGPGTSFQVKIHSGTIAGTVLGTSLTTFVPDGTNTGGGSIITHFTFAAPVALTPGTINVIEVVQLPPFVGGTANFAIGGNFGNSYTRGQAIISGAPSSNFDFYFVEGITVVPEPASAGMLAIGTLGLAGWATRRRRSR